MSNAHDWEQMDTVKRIGGVMRKAGPITKRTTAAPAGAPYRTYSRSSSSSARQKRSRTTNYSY